MASVNLWELITTVASHRYSHKGGPREERLQNSEKCEDIQCVIAPRFGTELTLEISGNGTWTVEIFDHEDSTQNVRLFVHADGKVIVERSRTTNGIHDRHSISF